MHYVIGALIGAGIVAILAGWLIKKIFDAIAEIVLNSIWR